MSESTITAVGVVMDCVDPVRLADFWQAAIGFEVRTGDGNPYVTLSGSSVKRPVNHITFQKVPEPKTVKNRTHLDLFARDPGAEVERLVGLGARVTEQMFSDPEETDLVFALMGDPEGHEFCVIARPGSTGT